MRKYSSLFVIVGLLALGVAPIADAQQRLSTSGRPNFGQRNISGAVGSFSVNVTSGGSLSVEGMGLGNGCTGYATSQPDYNFTVQGGAIPFLRIFVDAGNQDTTLVVNRADGTWVCDDDTFGRNPKVDLMNAGPGLYNVWIGSYQSGTQARGTLNVTTNPNAQPGNAGAVVVNTPPPPSGGGAGRLSTSANPNFGRRNVTPGFGHDPLNVNVVSGGNIHASELGLAAGCEGWVTSQPDYNFTLTANDAFLRVYVDHVQANADTTLIINKADGSWICNDDSFGGRSPSVDLTNAGPGLYNVWIGSYTSGTQARGRLNITELPQNHP